MNCTKLNSINDTSVSQETNDKIIWIELLRIFCCFGVVLLHIASSHFYDTDQSSIPWKICNFYHGISRYAVPIFVMISGLLYLDKSKHISLKKLYSKYILRLFIIYVFWCIFYGVSTFILSAKAPYSLSELINQSIVNGIMNPKYHLWYVPVLICLLIITPMLKNIVNGNHFDSKKICTYFIILFVIFKIIFYTFVTFTQYNETVVTILSTFSPDLVCGWAGYYILGYYLYNYDLNKKFQILISVLGYIFILIGIKICSFLGAMFKAPISAFYDNFTIFQFFFVLSIFLLFKNRVSKIHWSENAKKIICSISKCTLGIYLIHPFIRDIAEHAGIDIFMFNPIILIPAISLGIFLISLVIIFILKKTPLINKWLI